MDEPENQSPQAAAPPSLPLATPGQEKPTPKIPEAENGADKRKGWKSYIGPVLAVLAFWGLLRLAHWFHWLFNRYAATSNAQVFVGLVAVAGMLVVGGLVTLVIFIPAARLNQDVKTEFYSARAAYGCVVGGLLLLILAATGAVSLRISQVLWGK